MITCKECKYYSDQTCNNPKSPCREWYRNPDWYCADAESIDYNHGCNNCRHPACSNVGGDSKNYCGNYQNQLRIDFKRLATRSTSNYTSKIKMSKNDI